MESKKQTKGNKYNYVIEKIDIKSNKKFNIYIMIFVIIISLIIIISSALIYIKNTDLNFSNRIQYIFDNIYNNILHNIEFYAPKILFALFVLLIGLAIAVLTYKFVFYLFKKFNIVELIDRLTLEFSDDLTEEITEKKVGDNGISEETIQTPRKKLSQKIKIDKIVAKSSAYYVFLLFFRYAITIVGIKDIEVFLNALIEYLPNLFIGFMIGFFGVRFADFIYDIIFHTLDFSGQKTSKALASGGKMIVLFFTVITVLDQVKVTQDIKTTVLTGVIAMMSIAGGIAFGLGGKDVAKEILENLKK